MKKIKSLFILMLMALAMIVVVGCEKESKIELSFAQESYSVVIGEELTIEPVIKNEKDEEFTLVFSSKDEAFVTYVAGKAKGIAVGEAKVKVSLDGNSKVFAEVTVKVTPVPTLKVTFNVDGGTAVADVNVVAGEAVARPTNPIKLGNVFMGWFSDEAKATEYNFDNPVNAALTLYAKWELADYEVSFEVVGGTAVTAIETKYGNKVTAPAAPTKDKYTFVGWFVDEDYSAEFDFDEEIVRDITLYAKWEIKSYDVTFNVDGGSDVPAQKVEVDKKVTKPATPTKAGFVFAGWYKEGEGTNKFDFSTETVTKDLFIYAIWILEADVHEVKLNWNYETKDQEFLSFLYDFYIWLDSKEIIDVEEMSFAVFSGKDKTGTYVNSKYIGEYIKYIGLTGDALAFNNTEYFANSVNHLRLQGTRELAPTVIDETYFFNSSAYNAKWVQYANWIHDVTKLHTNRFWDQSVGQYDMMRYVTGLNFADASYVKVDGTANYNLGDFTMAYDYHAYSNSTLPVITYFGMVFKGWNTAADGSGTAYTVLPVDSPKDLVLYAIFDYPVATNQILVDPAMELAANEEFIYNSFKFKVGETAFTSLADGLLKLQDGYTLILKTGTYADAFAITVPNVTIKGDGVAIITNKITLSGANGTTITKLEFTGLGQIYATGAFDGFVFKDNKVYDSTIVATEFAPNNRTDVNAFIQLYSGAGSNVLGDITITNNTFIGMTSDIIALDRTSADKTITITDNEFKNFGVGAIRFDGGYNSGIYNILRNKFENDVLGASAAIVFRAYSAAAGKTQTINIENNTFKNIGNIENKDPADTYPVSAVITSSTFNDVNVLISIKNNVFQGNVNDIHLRNSGGLVTTWTANINNNQFLGTKNYIYYETVDLADFNLNYYEDAEGVAITDLEVLATLIKTNTNYDELGTKPS